MIETKNRFAVQYTRRGICKHELSVRILLRQKTVDAGLIFTHLDDYHKCFICGYTSIDPIPNSTIINTDGGSLL